MTEQTSTHILADTLEQLRRDPNSPALLLRTGTLCLQAGERVWGRRYLGQACDADRYALAPYLAYFDASLEAWDFHTALQVLSAAWCYLPGEPRLVDGFATLREATAAAASPSETCASSPLVSILLPTRNRPHLLPTAVESCLRQTYGKFELIVVNDGGTDVGSLLAAYEDDRIRAFALPKHEGMAAASNLALDQAKGELIAILGDDDLYYPHHLAVTVQALREHPQAGAVYSDHLKVSCEQSEGARPTITEKGLVYSQDFDRMHLLHRNYIPHPCLVHRRELLERTGTFDLELRALIDWDFVRRLAFFADFVHVPIVTGEYFCPLDSSGRITGLLQSDPEAWKAQGAIARRTLPPVPWVAAMNRIGFLLDARTESRYATAALELLHSEAGYPYRLLVAARPDQAAFAETLRHHANWNDVTAVLSIGETTEIPFPSPDFIGHSGCDFFAFLPLDRAPDAAWYQQLMAHCAQAYGLGTLPTEDVARRIEASQDEHLLWTKNELRGKAND